MARMKFLCDADRCIDCNACVTACKNENEVPWGINRRRVVTINDGKPGERSVSMACMHCTDAPCAAVCPVNCIYPTEDGVVLHSKDLCIGCGYCFYACPFGAPQYPQVGNFGSRGKMDKCTYCAGGGGAGSARQHRGIREIRLQPLRRRQAAAVRRDVLDQVAARRRRRDHRPDLQGAGAEARLRLRRLGLDDGLSRGHRGLSGSVRGERRHHEEDDRHDMSCAHSPRCPRHAAACARCGRGSGGRAAAQPGRRAQSDRERHQPNATCCRQVPRIEGRIDIPDTQGQRADPAGRTDLGLFPRGAAALGRRDRDPRHDRAAWRSPI